MKFTKMQGAGNDFIIIDNREYGLTEAELSALAARVCKRRVSIGADGLMAVDADRPAGAGEPETAGGSFDAGEEPCNFRMTYFNSDGSLGEMCGNGARCISRYGYEHGLAGADGKMRIRTTAGIVLGERIDQRNYRIRLNDVTTLDLDRTFFACGRVYQADYIELGDPGLPHLAVAIPRLAKINGPDKSELFEIGRTLRHDASLPKGANVNFYEITGPDEIYELTYERGVEDFTLACGTGTGSVVSALTAKGLVSGQGVRVRMGGGTLVIDAVKKSAPDGSACIADLYLTGPTNIVAAGEILDEELSL